MDENYRKENYRRQSFANLSEEEIFVLAQDKMECGRYFLKPYLTMEALAEEMNVHRNALSRAVNRYAGRTFPQWLGEYRIAELERLSEMVENYHKPLEELALLAGFSCRASFYRVFRKIRNGSPLALLRNPHTTH